MNNRRLIEVLLACGREIQPVPDDVRERIFSRVLAVAAAEPRARIGPRLRGTCRVCRRRRLGRRLEGPLYQ